MQSLLMEGNAVEVIGALCFKNCVECLSHERISLNRIYAFAPRQIQHSNGVVAFVRAPIEQSILFEILAPSRIDFLQDRFNIHQIW
ncbi:Hypothetical protein RAK1035_3324 [Roseovarius sp. AK1035]|nr:Hypothetical protein RAK1035_3324 [Roseovarius sp. AK1035]